MHSGITTGIGGAVGTAGAPFGATVAAGAGVGSGASPKGGSFIISTLSSWPTTTRRKTRKTTHLAIIVPHLSLCVSIRAAPNA